MTKLSLINKTSSPSLISGIERGFDEGTGVVHVCVCAYSCVSSVSSVCASVYNVRMCTCACVIQVPYGTVPWVSAGLPSSTLVTTTLPSPSSSLGSKVSP